MIKVSQIKYAVERNIFNQQCMVHSLHIRTDKIRVFNHTFRKPVSLEYAREILKRMTRGQTVWNCILYASGSNGRWPL